MTPDATLSLLRDYGWFGVLLWLIAERILPVVKDTIIPQRAAERKFTREHLAQIEERQVMAFEKTAEAVSELSKCYLVANERLSHIEGCVDTLLGREKKRTQVRKTT